MVSVRDAPYVCSFCGERPVVAWFEGPDFLAYVDSPAKVRAEEAWLTCSTCLALVEVDERGELVRRGVERIRRRQPEMTIRHLEPVVQDAQRRCWTARS